MECSSNECQITSPVGNLLVRYCYIGLHAVRQVEFTADELPFRPDLSTRVEIVDESGELNHVVTETVEWFRLYFNKLTASLLKTPPICTFILKTLSFDACQCLTSNVFFGKTISYGNLAKLMCRPGASRSVGVSMSTNPIQIIVPVPSCNQK